jgi:WD40 repeat protein
MSTINKKPNSDATSSSHHPDAKQPEVEKASPEGQKLRLQDLDHDVLAVLGTTLTPQGWLSLQAASEKVSGMQAALQSAPVLKHLMHLQNTPPPIIQGLLHANDGLARARSYVAEKSALHAKLATAPMRTLLSGDSGAKRHDIASPDGLGVLSFFSPSPRNPAARPRPGLVFTHLQAGPEARGVAIRLGDGVPPRSTVRDAVFSRDGDRLYLVLGSGAIVRLQRSETAAFAEPLQIHRFADVGEENASLSLSPDGRLLLVARHESGAVALLDLEEGRCLHQSQALRQTLHNFSPQSYGVFCSDSSVLMLDQAQRLLRLDRSQSAGWGLVEVELERPEGSRLSLQGREGTAPWVEQSAPTGPTLLDAQSLAVLKRVEVPAGGSHLIHASGRLAVVWNRAEHPPALTISDTRGAEPKTIELALHPQDRTIEHVACAPDGSKVAFSQGRSGLFVVDLDQGQPQARRLTGPQGLATLVPSFSPDGALLLTQDGNYLHVHATQSPQ